MNVIDLCSGTPDPGWLDRAAAWIAGGGVVVYPTDTFYGVAVDPCSPAAVEAVFALKGRDASQAIPLIASSLDQVEAFCGPLAAGSRRLAEACWPGPLSLIATAPPQIAPAVHAGRGSIAIRVPAQETARALAEACGRPITASSANVSGQSPAREVGAVGEWLADPRVLVIDGGPTPGGLPSTLVDARVSPPVLVREGAVSWDRVLRLLHG